MNSTNIRHFCPVPALTILASGLLLASCGKEAADAPLPEPVEAGPADYARPLEVTGFQLRESAPDDFQVRWTGEGPAEVLDINVSEGDEILPGDTLAELLDDVQTVLAERLAMELDMAAARLASTPSDSGLVHRVDSLAGLLDSLETQGAEPLLAPLQGTVTDIYYRAGSRIRPGGVMLSVRVPGDRVFQVFPPEGCTVYSWPRGNDRVRFIEEGEGYGVYSGDQADLQSLFQRIVSVDRVAVFESEMNSYIITSEGDTIPALRVGETEVQGVLILPDRPPGDRLATWADRE
ncbi:MAG: hypothetical protein R6U39_11885 [Candidatus Aegiribacteria sp.]